MINQDIVDEFKCHFCDATCYKFRNYVSDEDKQKYFTDNRHEIFHCKNKCLLCGEYHNSEKCKNFKKFCTFCGKKNVYQMSIIDDTQKDKCVLDCLCYSYCKMCGGFYSSDDNIIGKVICHKTIHGYQQCPTINIAKEKLKRATLNITEEDTNITNTNTGVYSENPNTNIPSEHRTIQQYVPPYNYFNFGGYSADGIYYPNQERYYSGYYNSYNQCINPYIQNNVNSASNNNNVDERDSNDDHKSEDHDKSDDDKHEIEISSNKDEDIIKKFDIIRNFIENNIDAAKYDEIKPYLSEIELYIYRLEYNKKKINVL